MKCSIAYILFLFLFIPVSLCAQQTQEKRPKVGLVLGGGGAKGAAEVGVLKVIEDVGIPIDYIAGTSIGSIVGGLYACGYRAADLDSLFNSQSWLSLFSDAGLIRRKNKGILKGDKVEEMLADMIKEKTGQADSLDFDQLPIPFRCVAVNTKNTTEVVFKSGNMAKAMRASMSIPVVFRVVKMDDMELVDGGILNNLPVDVVREMGADVVIAIDLTQNKRATKDLDWKQEKGLKWLLQWVKERPDLVKYNQNVNQVDVYINPNLKGYSAADFIPKKIKQMIQRGEKAGENSRGILTKFNVSL